MSFPEYDFVGAADVRRAVVTPGDIREDIGFQNDINLLLARLDAGQTTLKALGWAREAVTPAPVVEEPVLRIIRGGAATPRPLAAELPHEVAADPFLGRVAIAIAL